ncbi:MAG: hypothetical protein IPI66_03270 [Chitinophagaceae bacterium]|nr:hypothetical protein [Chitinophagaceae bacterium]MBL0055379.1 hypothetical protein [Chitinophagaceae bacterium]
MKKPNPTNPSVPDLFRSIRNFFGKLRQNPDIYPIRYYKKGRRFRRNWQENIVK